MLSLCYNILKEREKKAKAKGGFKMTKELLNLNDKQIEKLISLGAKRWTKYGRDRLYIRDTAKELGLDYDRYNTGNIRYASFNGEKISNSQCRRMLDQIDGAYINLATGEIMMGGREEEAQMFISALEKIIL